MQAGVKPPLRLGERHESSDLGQEAAIAKAKALENRIAETEKEAAKLEAELADPETWKNPEEAAEKTKRYNGMKAEIEQLYEELFQV